MVLSVILTAIFVCIETPGLFGSYTHVNVQSAVFIISFYYTIFDGRNGTHSFKSIFVIIIFKSKRIKKKNFVAGHKY